MLVVDGVVTPGVSFSGNELTKALETNLERNLEGLLESPIDLLRKCTDHE